MKKVTSGCAQSTLQASSHYLVQLMSTNQRSQSYDFGSQWVGSSFLYISRLRPWSENVSLCVWEGENDGVSRETLVIVRPQDRGDHHLNRALVHSCAESGWWLQMRLSR